MNRRWGPNGRAGQGFTLIELMIVVAAIAILAAIAYPSYADSVRKSRRGQAKADLVEYAQLAERHHTVNNTYAGFAVPVAQSPREGKAYYAVVVSDVTPAGYLITATPTPAQAADTCGALTINAAGVKTHSKGTASACQFGTPVE